MQTVFQPDTVFDKGIPAVDKLRQRPVTLFENYCKSFPRFVSKLSTAEKEKTEDFRPPLYPPLAQILPQNRFTVNPWFTMNHEVQTSLYVRHR
jgi:hypothetical protein